MHCLSFQSAYFQTDNVAISCTMYSDCGFASNDWVFVVSPPMTVCLWFLPNGCVLVVSTPMTGCLWFILQLLGACGSSSNGWVLVVSTPTAG